MIQGSLSDLIECVHRWGLPKGEDRCTDCKEFEASIRQMEIERDRYRAALELIVGTGSNDNHILEIARAALKGDQ